MQVGGVDEVGPAVESEQPVVLVAEDEVLIRLAIAECLRVTGFIVIEAASAEEAQIALQAIPGIDAVFSDINMPDSNDGVELVLWMAARLPNVPVILTSGRSNPVQAMTVSSCPNVTDFLPKPYQCAEVERLLRKRIADRKKSPT
jgi:DNA-binding NtrC family response regulator